MTRVVKQAEALVKQPVEVPTGATEFGSKLLNCNTQQFPR